jgi:hypothetical protein
MKTRRKNPMTCPKCKNNQFGNYCSECGEKLRERCAECGKMEFIDRKVCETKLAEAKKEKEGYIGLWDLQIRLMQPFSVLFPIIVAFITEYYVQKYFPTLCRIILWSIMGVIVLTPVVLLEIARVKSIKKRTREFPQKFPHLAEILKRAEGGK